MNLPSNLRNIETALKNVSAETRKKAMFEEVEHSRKQREVALSLIKTPRNPAKFYKAENYSPLLEEVIAGNTTFVQRMAEIGSIPVARQNMHVFHEPLYLEEFFEDVKYLDRKISELYHSKD